MSEIYTNVLVWPKETRKIQAMYVKYNIQACRVTTVAVDKEYALRILSVSL